MNGVDLSIIARGRAMLLLNIIILIFVFYLTRWDQSCVKIFDLYLSMFLLILLFCIE